MRKANQLIKNIKHHADPIQAEVLERFFKTGRGEYAEGDRFLGVKVPQIRTEVKQFYDLTKHEIKTLLENQYHEIRFAGLLILIQEYYQAEPENKESWYKFYMRHLKGVNNWDLVDLSASAIAGDFLCDRNKKVLYEMAESDNLWERRIAIIATFAFIKHGHYKDTFEIAKKLIDDEHDLIHKATGWMLREVGNKDRDALTDFLDQHATKMPRTMLRYAIEKLPERTRQHYLNLE